MDKIDKLLEINARIKQTVAAIKDLDIYVFTDSGVNSNVQWTMTFYTDVLNTFITDSNAILLEMKSTKKE